ncbi:hypothetical protein [Nannocystis radixulma]|uniref:HEAT repeat-containing protein n=1 Tax=Nannocystis radixulma TaxID=2995305 RepID=A0ABT5BGJ8_9BACT|nr:hypothetical protein [Nannocystis radixulma]MDC0673254.1 hypothetical protein [Nannocystis radixulma]
MLARELLDPNDEDRARHAQLIAGLRGPGEIRKLQCRLQKLERLWREVQPSYRSRMRTRRGIVPTADEVACVARFATHPASEVRRCVIKLMGHARTHLELVAPVVAAGLADSDVVVQLHAAEAALELGAGARLEAELSAALDSPTWRVRWYAAVALAGTAQRERAAEVLLASFPARGNPMLAGGLLFAGCWERLVRAFTPPTPAIAARLAELGASRGANP